MPGVTIRRDGVDVGREQWGAAVPIDPGAHAVAVYVPGKQPWATAVEVPMEGKIVTVELPPLSTLQNASPVAVATPPATAAPPAWRR